MEQRQAMAKRPRGRVPPEDQPAGLADEVTPPLEPAGTLRPSQTAQAAALQREIDELTQQRRQLQGQMQRWQQLAHARIMQHNMQLQQLQMQLWTLLLLIFPTEKTYSTYQFYLV